MPPMRRLISYVVALGLVLAACSGPEAIETTTTTSSTTTSTTTTIASTTLGPPVELSPINGLPVDDPALLDRRVVAVKIDNHFLARPQSGINQADAVIEVLVEGITRFITIWQQSDSDYLGPQRSGRPTDAYLLPAFGETAFAISGAQSWVQSLIKSKGINLVGEVKPATFRVSGRSAPHNLYVNTNLLRDYADGRGYADEPQDGPMWQFGILPDTATQIESVKLNFPGNVVEWTWGATEQAWLRTVSGNDSNWRDKDGTEGRIAMPVMVALYGEAYTASPPSGVAGKSLPSTRSIGSGKAFVFAEGKVVEGTWERETEAEWFTLRDADGNIIAVPPGKIWISLIPGNNGVTLNPGG